jgi:membrane-associated phospholipid phosphatase
MSRRISLLALAATSVLAACRESQPPDPQLVGQWLRTSLAIVRSERLGPPVAARISAYSSLALYEGYASDSRSNLRSLAGQLNGLGKLPQPADGRRVDGATVAAEAERVVLDSLLSEGYASTRRAIDSLAKAQIEARRAAGVGGDLRERSVRHGHALGHAILAWAATDGFFDTRGRPWKAPTAVAQWVNTVTTDQFVAQQLSGESDVVLTGSAAPTSDAARASTRNNFANRPKALGPKTTLPQFNPVKPTEPYWGTLRTFAIRDGDECAPPPPPAYSEKTGSEFWKMGKDLYDSVQHLSPEKQAIALFWADNPVATGTPGFHWISVVNQMIERRHLTADQAAEAYALTSVAIADAFVGCWKEKYRSLVVRPVTYVHRVFDPKWTTLFSTPPFPEYPSGHSTLSGAAAEVLIGLLGDSTSFVDSSQVDIGAPSRSFRNFSHARDEVAVSRVYGGIHYVPAVVNGLAQGLCIGRRVLSRLKTRASTS